jgi:hypothetical protein
MQYEESMIIHFLVNRNWRDNKSAATLEEDLGQDVSALRTAQGWLIEL